MKVCAWSPFSDWKREKLLCGARSISPHDSFIFKCTVCCSPPVSHFPDVYPSFLPLQTQLIQMVIWMLQHRLLIQLHTYVCLMVPPNEEELRAQDEDMPFTARVGGRSLSTPNALSFGSPSMSTFLFSSDSTSLLELLFVLPRAIRPW